MCALEIKNETPLLNGIDDQTSRRRDRGVIVPLYKGTLWENKYQRRTQKGTGRTEKTEHTGAAKNPRLLKACNITEDSDMGEFFIISIQMKLIVNIFTVQRWDIFRVVAIILTSI